MQSFPVYLCINNEEVRNQISEDEELKDNLEQNGYVLNFLNSLDELPLEKDSNIKEFDEEHSSYQNSKPTSSIQSQDKIPLLEEVTDHEKEQPHDGNRCLIITDDVNASQDLIKQGHAVICYKSKRNDYDVTDFKKALEKLLSCDANMFWSKGHLEFLSESKREVFNQERFTKNLKDLLGETYFDWDWRDYAEIVWLLSATIVLASGGTFPFVIFNGKFIQKNFPGNDWLDDWSTGASAIANESISIVSVASIPDIVLRGMPRIVKKVINKFSQHGKRAFLDKDLWKIIASTFVVGVVNGFSIYAGAALGSDANKDFSHETGFTNPAALSVLYIAQVAGTLALVLRSTFSKYRNISLSEEDEIAYKLRLNLFDILNQSRSQRLPDNVLQDLARGKLYRDSQSTRNIMRVVFAISMLMILCVIVYGIAYGRLATSVLGAFNPNNIMSWANVKRALNLGSNAISKGMLCGLSVLGIPLVIKGLVADGHIKDVYQLAKTTKFLLMAGIFIGTGWNTWFSGADITQENLWDELIFDCIVGIGATFAINYLDQVRVFIDILVQKATDFHYRRTGKTPATNIDEIVDRILSRYSKMSPQDFCARYTERYTFEASEEQKDNFNNFTKELYNEHRVVPDRKYFHFEQCAKELRNLVPRFTAVDNAFPGSSLMFRVSPTENRVSNELVMDYDDVEQKQQKQSEKFEL